MKGDYLSRWSIGKSLELEEAKIQIKEYLANVLPYDVKKKIESTTNGGRLLCTQQENDKELIFVTLHWWFVWSIAGASVFVF